jgi:hypothetical protein
MTTTPIQQKVDKTSLYRPLGLGVRQDVVEAKREADEHHQPLCRLPCDRR